MKTWDNIQPGDTFNDDSEFDHVVLSVVGNFFTYILVDGDSEHHVSWEFISRARNAKWKITQLKPERWKPKINKIYWYINDYGISNNVLWNNHSDDNFRFEIGNCFRTREEAEAYGFKMIAKLKELIEE